MQNQPIYTKKRQKLLSVRQNVYYFFNFDSLYLKERDI